MKSTIISDEEIKDICSNYNIECSLIGQVINTSKDNYDVRHNYVINNEYFLKITNSKSINEESLNDISLMINNYSNIGVYCPRLINNNMSKFTHFYIKDNIYYTCFIEEKANHPTYNEDSFAIDYEFKKEVVKHLGVLASNFSNKNLSKTNSMWSIIKLSLYDHLIDEKQENLNDLVDALNERGFSDIAKKIVECNNASRVSIKKVIKKLPRCVYQGDLNNSNILIDENGKFAGVIDYNMFGTEVNINCFLNESMYYIEEDDFKKLSGKDIFCKVVETQNNLMQAILGNYMLNLDEVSVINDYNRVIFLSFYPNVALIIKLLKKKIYISKIIEFLNLACVKKSKIYNSKLPSSSYKYL